MSTLTPAQTRLVKDIFQVCKDYLTARSKEHNTHLGSIAAAIAGQPIIDGLSQATLALLAQDYPTAITQGLPAMLGIFGIGGAVLTPMPTIKAGELAPFSAQVSDLTAKCEPS